MSFLRLQEKEKEKANVTAKEVYLEGLEGSICSGAEQQSGKFLSNN